MSDTQEVIQRRRCYDCKELLPLSCEFYLPKRHGARTKFAARCRPCHVAHMRLKIVRAPYEDPI